jgi:hypothetical protein
MRNALRAYLLLAMIAAPVYAQSGSAQQGAGVVNCPMMTDVGDMQKQMGGMMTDMRALMDGTGDPAVKARMQAMHERMSAMMTNMQKMPGGKMGAPMQGGAKAAEPPATPPPAAGKEDHEAHHPGQ